MDNVKNSLKRPIDTLNCRGRILTVDKPLVMGILNVTPDSFYSGSMASGVEEYVVRATKMLEDGAAMIDLGGQSTRPGSNRVDVDEEMRRVVPVVGAICKAHPDAVISIDTYSSSVARAAVEAGASMVNDISGGELDAMMVQTVASLGVPYIIMHMKGEPSTMQDRAVYTDLTREVIDYFISKVDACRKAGIKDIIIDPGFGFSKTSEHTFLLLRQFHMYRILGLPILAGLSRKSTIYKALGTTAEHALNGTTVLNTIALLNGASILRVHDVKEAVEAVTLVGKYRD